MIINTSKHLKPETSSADAVMQSRNSSCVFGCRWSVEAVVQFQQLTGHLQSAATIAWRVDQLTSRSSSLSGGRLFAELQTVDSEVFPLAASRLSRVPLGRKQTKLGTVLISAVTGPRSAASWHPASPWKQKNSEPGGVSAVTICDSSKTLEEGVFRFSPQCFTVWLVADRTDVRDEETRPDPTSLPLSLLIKDENTQDFTLQLLWRCPRWISGTICCRTLVVLDSSSCCRMNQGQNRRLLMMMEKSLNS